jgi:hypothetical protein
MNRYEFEGTVVPSGLVLDGVSRPRNHLDFPALYAGRVQQVYYPDSDDNFNKIYPEYDVVIEYENLNNRLRTATIMYRCRVASLFGGVADYETWTPRKAKSDSLTADPRNNQSNPGQQFEAGSQVLVLCLNGNSQTGVIIGGVPHSNGAKQTDRGVSWVRRFNGVTMQIDDDGQFILSFEGATEADGKRRDSADEKAAGSKMTFAKDGGVKLETKDGQQSVHLDHVNNKIAVRANAELEITGLDPDGSTPKFHLSMKDGELTVKLQDGASLAVVGKDGNTQMTVGDGAKHVAIVEALEALYNQLKLKLDLFDAHIHPSAMGPTGPPAPMVMAPAWDPAINSTKVSIPNG